MALRKNHPSALNEKEGISQPESISTTVIHHIKNLKQKLISPQELIDGILNQNITALSRAITLVESTNTEHLSKANEVINGCLPYAKRSVMIGLTGLPKVGKSTFIGAF